MQEKIIQLELLVSQAAQRLANLERENAALKNRVRTVEGQNERLRKIEEEIRTLRDWKRDTLAQLKKLHGKIGKEIR